MDLIKYFVENFDIKDYEIKASIFAESMNCNNLTFTINSHDWYISFSIWTRYGKENEVISSRVNINHADFLGKYKQELEQKLADKLKDKKFIDQLNSAIQKEKDRVNRVYENTMQQGEIKVFKNAI